MGDLVEGGRGEFHRSSSHEILYSPSIKGNP